MGLTHDFTSAKTNTNDATIVGSTKWNNDHIFSGGNLGALLYQGTAGVVTGIDSAASGKLLRATGPAAVPAWSTATYPDTVAIGDLLVATSANTLAGLAAAAAGKLLRAAGAASVPAWSTSTYPDTVTTGDLLVATTTNTLVGLATGAAGSVLIGGTVPSWSAAVLSPSASAVTSTVPFIAPDGTAALPGFAFTSQPSYGFHLATGNLTASVAGVSRVAFLASSLQFKSDVALSWSSGVINAVSDLFLSRGAANRLLLAVGDVLNLAPTAFASLPTGAEGDMACITDASTATWGATIAGGGANNVLAFFNGTNWTVMGA